MIRARSISVGCALVVSLASGCGGGGGGGGPGPGPGGPADPPAFVGTIVAFGDFIPFSAVTVTISDAALTVHRFPNGQLDDGIDETNYDLTGTIHVPSTLPLGGAVCVTASPSQPIAPTNVKVLKTSPRLRFAVVEDVEYVCTAGATPFPAALYFFFGTLVEGPYTTCQVGDLAVAGLDTLSASYVTSCATSHARGGWTFTKQ